MRHRLAGRHLGRDTAHRTALYRNLVTDLLRYERITTTQAKAKEIRPMAERLITLARRGDLHARRLALRVVYDERVVRKAFDDIGPRMKDRPGGYLRITSVEPRKGDGAHMAVIELVDYVEAPATPRPQRVTAAPSAAAPASPPVADDVEDADDASHADDAGDLDATQPATAGASSEAQANIAADAPREPQLADGPDPADDESSEEGG